MLTVTPRGQIPNKAHPLHISSLLEFSAAQSANRGLVSNRAGSVSSHAGPRPRPSDLGQGHLGFCHHWGCGATAARLTPDQKVGSSNLSALTLPAIIPVLPQHMVKLHWPLIAPFLDPGLCRSVPVTHVFGFSFPPLWALLSFAHPLLHCLV